MATIAVDRVVSRYNVSFERRRKAMDAYLNEVRQLLRQLTKPKKSEQGCKTSCYQLEQQLPPTLQSVAKLRENVRDMRIECEQCLFTPVEDERAQWPRRMLSRQIDSVCGYMEHLYNRFVGRLAMAAVDSVWRNGAKVVAAIDDAKKLNTHFGKVINAYLSSKQFSELCRDVDSPVTVLASELRGTPAECKALIAKWQAADGGSDNELDDRNLTLEETVEAFDFIVPDDEQEELPDESSEAVINEDDLSSEHDSEGDSSSDSAEDSNGTVLYEANMAKHNAKLLKSTANNGIVRSGRLLRKRKYRAIDMDLVAPSLDLIAELEDRSKKRKRAPKDDCEEDEGDDGPSEVDLESSDDESFENIVMREEARQHRERAQHQPKKQNLRANE